MSMTAMVYRLLIILCVIFPAREYAECGVSGSDDFPISQDFSLAEQNNPSIAYGGDGKFAVVWCDYRNGAGDIYCRLYDSGAAAEGGNFSINDDGAAAWQFEPDISSDGNGNYFVAWKDYRNGNYPFDPDIYYQRLDSAGFVGVNQNITVEQPDSSHQSPSIGANNMGKQVIAWTDLRYVNWDIFFQGLDADGNPVGSNTRVNDDNEGKAQHDADVSVSPDGWFVVVWYDGRNGNDDIYLQKFDSAGNAIGGNIRVNDDGTSAKQKSPSVAIGGQGIIRVVWTDWRNGSYPSNPDIYCQRLDSDLNRLGGNTLINFDGNQTSQRNPKVAADRLGYSCVVWADSVDYDWEIKGQIFDASGMRIGDNFTVNLNAAGKQLHADVAMDGQYLYCAWADDREGNFDIFGRVWQYNDRSLVASPSRLSFSRDITEPDPVAQYIHIARGGDDEIVFRLEKSKDWIILSKNSGTTPDSFFVSVNSWAMSQGDYDGVVWLVDNLSGDTTGYVNIDLTITGPIIDFAPDTLNFRALIEIGDPADQDIVINNAGTGSLDYTLATSESWLILDKNSGTGGETVIVSCDISSLIAGSYEAYIIASDARAANSPESLSVSLEVLENMPYLAAEPGQVALNVVQGGSGSAEFRVVNLAAQGLNWSAYSPVSWLTLQTSSGHENDTVNFTVESASLSSGVYLDSIRIEENMAFNSPIYVPVEVTVVAEDTVEIIPAQAESGNRFQAPLYLDNKNAVISGYLKFHYDKTMVKIDSLSGPAGENTIEDRTMSIDTISGTFTVSIQPAFEKGNINGGYYHMGDICGTANDSLTGTAYFEADTDLDSFYLDLDMGFHTEPYLKGGEVDISIASSVNEFEPEIVPSTFYLGQNSPNPFNGVTSISFGLKRSGTVRLVVFNILGQQVDILAAGSFTAGQYTILWDGRDSDGCEMASGIYFYRLQTDEYMAVKKMIYLK